MGLRFRKSVNLGPVRINASKSGLGYSIGTKGLRYTKKARGGSRTTASIPRTGISYVRDSKKKHIKKSSSKSKANPTKKTVNSSNNNNSNAPIDATPNYKTVSIIAWVFAGLCFIWMLKKFTVFRLATVLLFALMGWTNHRQAEKVNAVMEIALQPEKIGTELPEPPQREQTESLPKEICVEIPKDPRIEQFENELNGIPKTDIPLSCSVPRQLLRNMPDYSISNITRKTRLDSIFPLVILDTETTGLRPSEDRIVEVSAIKFDFGMIPVSCFTTLCNPGRPIPSEVSKINHITDDIVADAPDFRQIAPALTEFMKGCNIAGHNIDFDLRFIFACGAQIPSDKRFYDTWDLAKLTISESNIYGYSLDTVCGYYGIRRENEHRSLSDCYATSKIFSRLVFDKTSRQLDKLVE